MTDSVIGLDASDPNKKITINKKDQREGTYILGSSGKGKSTLIENVVLEDIKNDTGICLLDPHGDLTDNIISRMAFQVGLLKNPKLDEKERRKYEHIKKRLENDVVYIDLGSETHVAPFNLFYCEDATNDFEVENIVSAFLHILDSSFDITQRTPMMNQYFRHIAFLLACNPNHTILDIRRLLADDAFLLKLVKNITDFHEREFWETFFIPYSKGKRRMEDISMITNKLEEFISPVMRPWFGDLKKTLHFRKFMDERKIVFIKLKSQWETLTKILGNIVIAQLLDAAYSRGDTNKDERKQMNVYVDEYAKFASEDFAKLFSEARKYGLALTVSQQVLEQVDPTIKAVCSQAANTIVFQVSPENAKELAKTFDCSPQPGPPRYEPLKTPVREPIQFMLTHGVYPQDTTEQFINRYGKLLVDNAKREEDLEGDRRHEEQRYLHDVVAGARYLAPPLIHVTQDNRFILKWLNDLFHKAMLAGKAGENPDDIPISPSIADAFIKTVGESVGYYLDLVNTYQQKWIPATRTALTTFSPRVQELQEKLAQLPKLLEEKTLELDSAIEGAKQHLRKYLKIYIQAEVIAVREAILVVEANGKFITGRREQDSIPRIYFDRPESEGYNRNAIILFEREESHKKPIDYDYIRKYYSAAVGKCHFFDTWEEALSFYLYLFQNCWFHIDPDTLFDKRYWRKTKREVYWKDKTKTFSNYLKNVGRRIKLSNSWDIYNIRGQFRYVRYYHDYEINYHLFLDTWELLPGIENFWVSPAMIEAEADRMIKEIENNISNPLWADRSFTHDLLFIKTSQLNPTFNHYHSPVIDTAQALQGAWENSKRKKSEELQKLTFETENQTTKIQEELALIEQIEKYKQNYDTFLKDFIAELRQILRELAESPVEMDSGLIREVPGPEIPSSEVELRIANQLKQLEQIFGKYTARVKISSGEYTLQTIKPTGYVSYNKLQQYIAEIQERNRKAGYLRLRSEVKKEIEQRYQLSVSPSPQLQQPTLPPAPQKPQQVVTPVAAQAAPIPRKRAITTPLGKQCPACGVRNSPTANFCQGCGKKLP